MKLVVITYWLMSKLAYSICTERYVPIYILFDSLISWAQEGKGQELPRGNPKGSGSFKRL